MTDAELLNEFFLENRAELELYRLNVTPENTQTVHNAMIAYGISERFAGAFLSGVLYGQFQDKQRGM